MKNLLFTLFISPFFLIAQTKTSVANGDFYNPLTWDCLCFPANGDNVITNMAGQIIQQGELNQAGINVSSLTSGMYLFQLNNLGVARFQKY